MSNNPQAVATTQPSPPPPALKQPLTLRQEIDSDYFKKQIAVALPRHMTPDRFARVALTALLKTPKLLDCTKESVIECLLNCSALGIEPDGRRAHLIPYGNKCTLIVDFKGIVELAKRSGDVAGVFAQIVCDHDNFTWENGEVTHQIDWKRPRGEMYAAYASITFKDGSKQTDVMTKDEIEAIRKRSKAGTSGPWVTDFNEMAKKTVFRRASKWITLSPEVADALEKDGDRFDSLKMDPELNQAKPDFSGNPQLANGGQDPTQPTAKRTYKKRQENAPATPIEATVTPQAEPAPAAAAATTPPPSTVNFVRGIRGLLTMSAVSEDELLEYGRAQKGWDDSLGELEEVNEAQPSKLEHTFNNWEEYAKAIKAGRGQ